MLKRISHGSLPLALEENLNKIFLHGIDEDHTEALPYGIEQELTEFFLYSIEENITEDFLSTLEEELSKLNKVFIYAIEELAEFFRRGQPHGGRRIKITYGDLLL